MIRRDPNTIRRDRGSIIQSGSPGMETITTEDHDARVSDGAPAVAAGLETGEQAGGARDAPAGLSAFDTLRAYISGQIGAVRQVQAEQHSAEELVDLAETELGDLKRAFEAARLPGR